MKTRSLCPLAAILLVTVILPLQASAQYAKNTNQSRKDRSIIAGGSGNFIPSNCITAFIGGGSGNIASSTYATVPGGDYNKASGQFGTVGGGYNNTASGIYYATVAGGYTNTASGTSSTVAGGEHNMASGDYAAVGGGGYNTASGDWSTIPGGRNAFATHDGSFVWGAATDIYTTSFASNSFTVRAAGGVRFITTTNSVFTGANTNNGVYLGPGENSWSALSDSNAKTAVESVDSRQILHKLAALPVTRWHYKGQPGRSYIGPMAQDFHQAFGLGHDDKRIATADTDGVMYAAIQGLVEELKDRDKAMAVRDKTIEELKVKSAELDSLRTEFHRLREHLEKTLPPSY